MDEHNGMRPHDVVVLLKLVSIGLQEEKFVAPAQAWQQKPLAAALALSQSEISASLRRSRMARLVSEDRRRVHPQSLLEFLCHGLRYVFPAAPGPVRRGMPTAHAAAPLNALVSGGAPYVWPSAEGEVRGEAVRPLYPGVTAAARQDAQLYELLALTDALRVGRAREINLAQELLKSYLLRG